MPRTTVLDKKDLKQKKDRMSHTEGSKTITKIEEQKSGTEN